MRLIAVVGIVFLSTAAVAAKPLSKPAALKLMHDRHEKMEKIGDATKAAGRALRSDSPDLAVIRKSAATIAGYAPKVRNWFPAGTGPDVGKTYAKAEVWNQPVDFARKSREFNVAAQAFNSAARKGDLPRIRSAFAAMGKTCKSCHDTYRSEHEH